MRKDKKKQQVRASSFLEKLVSKTKKFQIEDLLTLYSLYDQIVTDNVFRLLLLPYTRFAKDWLRDQARDLLANSDRNRLIITSRARKSAEAAYEAMPKEEAAQWPSCLKPKNTRFVADCLRLLHRVEASGLLPTFEEVQALGASRMVYDDLGVYFTALTSRYPTLVADWLSAKADGDDDDLQAIEAEMLALEEHVGVRRDDAWYVIVNVLSNYDLVEKIIQRVTTAYMRLLFRFAHRVRGITTTEENFSAGCEGMIRAVRNYDPVDGSSFTIHCQWWVRSAILQRQRQASVILLPSTTWSQLAQIQKGQGSFSDERVSDLKERAEMFFANSANALKAQDREQDDYDDPFEGVLVTSPDAIAVLGDAVARSQGVEEMYEREDVIALGNSLMDGIFHLLHEEDPGLIFPVLLWALNSGIDATLLAERSASLFLGEKEIEQERNRQKQTKALATATPAIEPTTEKPTKPQRHLGTKPHRTGRRYGHIAQSRPAYKNAFALG